MRHYYKKPTNKNFRRHGTHLPRIQDTYSSKSENIRIIIHETIKTIQILFKKIQDELSEPKLTNRHYNLQVCLKDF